MAVPAYIFFYLLFFLVILFTWLYASYRVLSITKRETARLKQFATPSRLLKSDERGFLSRMYFDYCRAFIGITLLFVFISTFFAYITYYVELEKNDPIPYFVIAGIALFFLVPLVAYLTNVLGSAHTDTKKALYQLTGRIQLDTSDSFSGHTHPAIIRIPFEVEKEAFIYLAFRVERNTLGIDLASEVLNKVTSGDLVSVEFTPLTKTVLSLKKV